MFTIRNLLSLCLIILSVTMVVACIWQVHRGQYKASLAAASTLKAATSLCNIVDTGDDNTMISTTLHLDAKRYFLLDNQVQQRQRGYTLIGLHFEKNCQTWFGIDLGWVANSEEAGKKIQDWQNIKTEALCTQPRGFLWTNHPPNKAPLWPKHLSYLDSDAFLAWAPKPTSPKILLSPDARLYQKAQNGQQLSMQAMRHYGYALQFAFFACLALGYCYHIQTDRSSHASQ